MFAWCTTSFLYPRSLFSICWVVCRMRGRKRATRNWNTWRRRISRNRSTGADHIWGSWTLPHYISINIITIITIITIIAIIMHHDDHALALSSTLPPFSLPSFYHHSHHHYHQLVMIIIIRVVLFIVIAIITISIAIIKTIVVIAISVSQAVTLWLRAPHFPAVTLWPSYHHSHLHHHHYHP